MSSDSLVGKTFGKLTPILKVRSRSRRRYMCECACGEFIILTEERLLLGHTKSCGCYDGRVFPYVLGKGGIKEVSSYNVWRNMLRRCYSYENRAYHYYGGRGIRVCSRWLNSFENFYEDMGEKPLGMSIDRKDVNGDYTPENCRWATPEEQGLNRRNARVVSLGERKEPLKVVARFFEVNYKLLWKYGKKYGFDNIQKFLQQKMSDEYEARLLMWNSQEA